MKFTDAQVERAAKAISAVRQNTTDERAAWANGEMDRPRCFAYATAALEAAFDGAEVLIENHPNKISVEICDVIDFTVKPGDTLIILRSKP